MSKGAFLLTGYQVGVPSSSASRVRQVLEICKRLGRVETLLDVGCGDGAFTLVLQKVTGAAKAYGVEMSPEGADAARSQGIECAVLDVSEEDLPFSEAFFDLVYCGEIIEHLFDPDRLLGEVHRVLKAGGQAIVTTPNLASWYNRLMLLLGYQPYRTSVSLRHGGAGKLLGGIVGWHQPDHIRVMTLRAFEELIKLHGFRIRRLLGYDESVALNPSGLTRIASLADRALSRFPSLASGMIAHLEKAPPTGINEST